MPVFGRSAGEEAFGFNEKYRILPIVRILLYLPHIGE